MNHDQKTRQALLAHCSAYPLLGIRDVFKFLYQSTFGCAHMVRSAQKALDYINAEIADAPEQVPCIEPLNGKFCRVHLCCTGRGVPSATLARLFMRSANRPCGSVQLLEKKLSVAAAMIQEGCLPLDAAAFASELEVWKAAGYPPVHHSDAFRQAYHPAYRVIARKYIPCLKLLLFFRRPRRSV